MASSAPGGSEDAGEMTDPNTSTGTAAGGPPEPEAPRRRLTRSRTDRVFGGVCGGLAAYLGVDSVWVRLAAVLLGLSSWGAAVVAYLVAWIVIPEGDPSSEAPEGRGAVFLGVVLILAGVAALVDRLFPAVDRIFWPLALVAAGVALLWRRSDGP